MCHGDINFIKHKFSLNIQKNLLLRNHKGDEANICIHVYDISFSVHKFCVFFELDENSGCYSIVKFPLTYNRKIGNCHLLRCSVLQIFLQNFNRNVSRAVLFQPCRFCLND